MKKSVKIFFEVLLFILCIGLVYLIVKSVMKPVEFKKQQQYRESVAIQRLKDIRTLQVAYKSENGKFVSTVDSLADFYNNGKMEIVMQIGSMADSLAVAHTDKIKKASRKKLTGEDLLKLYEAGDKNLVFNVATKIPVKDTLFLHRDDFVVDSLKYIPFSGGQPVFMDAVVKTVTGVPVPLFEAKMPYKLLLRGMDNQLRINLDAERRDQNRYEGLAEVASLKGDEVVKWVDVPRYDAVLVYAVPSEDVEAMPELYHVLEALPLCRDYNKIVASHKEGNLYLAIAQGGSLLLANVFEAPDFTTAEYYIFLALKQLQLNPEVSTICLRSFIGPEEEMSLYRYFKSVEQI